MGLQPIFREVSNAMQGNAATKEKRCARDIMFK
jgi:hypothetical protein